MNKRLTASIAAIAMLVVMFAPLSVGDYDSIDSDDYSITIPGTDVPYGTVVTTMGSGTSASWTLYVVNNSEKYLDVSFGHSADTDNLKFTTTPANVLLGPRDSEFQHISSGTVTLLADIFSPTIEGQMMYLEIVITDIEDKTTDMVMVIFDVNITSSYVSDSQYNMFFGIIPNTLPEPFNNPFITMIVTIIGWLVVTYALSRFAVLRIINYLDKGDHDKDNLKIAKKLVRLVVLLIFILAINQGLSIVGADPMFIMNVAALSNILCIVMVVMMLWITYRFLVIRTLESLRSVDEEAADMTLLPLFMMLGKLIFWVGGASAVLAVLGINLQAILVSAGVLTLGITLGAQNVLSQFFNGLVLLISKPFSIGDFLKINDKVYVVRNVKLMYTEFRGWDNDQIITMPNNTVMNSTIVNLTKEDPAFMLYTYYSVAYGSDLDKVEKVALEAARKNEYVLNDPDHNISTFRLTNFQDSGMEVRVGCVIKDFNCSSAAASAIRKAVYNAFLDNDIEIPYNRLEIDMLEPCDGKKKENDTKP